MEREPSQNEVKIKAIVSRRPSLAPQVVFADGISGSGKTALSMILSSLERVGVHQIEPLYEQICVMRHLQRIKEDCASTLIRIHADLACHDMMIARGANFRPEDISSVLLQEDLYRKRLLMPDGEEVLSRIQSERPILHVMTHQCFGVSEPLWKALGERCFIIQMVRNPLFLLTAWYSYIDRYGQDPLEFDICYDYKERDLPWFALGWEERYLESCRMDRIIYSIQYLTQLQEGLFARIDSGCSGRILTIPFKYLVSDPWPHIEAMEKMLGVRRTPLLERVLKEQNIPRKLLTDVPDLKAFHKYGWKPLTQDISPSIELERQWDLAQSEASPQALSILEGLYVDYERKFPS